MNASPLHLTPRLLPACMIAALSALSLGLALRGAAIFVPLFVILGVAWGYSRHRRQHGLAGILADLVLVVAMAGAAIGLLIGALPALMLLAVVMALGTWDLTHFERRLRAIARVERAGDLERRHVRWLLVAVVCGSAIASFALAIRTTLGFGAMVALGLLAALALSLTISTLRRESSGA